METPCIRLCKIEPRTGWCLGCGRDLTEITGWGSMDDAGRRRVMAGLPARLAEMQGASEKGGRA